MSVGLDVLGDILMAGQARLIAVLFWVQLFIGFALVQAMARGASHFSLAEACRFDHARVFTTGDAHGVIWPKRAQHICFFAG